MHERADIDLLRQFAADRSDEAFATLVSRHLNLVYSAALRHVRDADLAKDVSQTVFLLLAKKARSLSQTTILASWLYRAAGYVAADVLKSENRRRHRETAAMEPLCESPSANAAPWREIEPFLDRAMEDLGEKDRALVLLRYFENKSLKDVGAAFGITEDAAQKRVARAVEKLRENLVRRGATVSSGTMIAAIAAFATQAAPPALAGSVVAAAATASVAVSVSAGTALAIHFISMSKMKIAAAAVLAVAAVSAPVVSQHRSLVELRAENQTLKARLQQAAAAPSDARSATGILPEELAQLRVEAAEVHQLRGEIALLKAGGPRPASAPRSGAPGAEAAAGGVTNPIERQKLAAALVREGKHAEALEHYLWAYDEGVKHMPSFSGVRGSFLLNEIKTLAASYAPARDALVSRRDELEKTLVANTSPNLLLPMDFVRLNDALDEQGRNLALFDQLPSDHPARPQLIEHAMEQFISESRIQDVAASGSPETVTDRAIFVAGTASLGGRLDSEMEARMRRNAVAAGGRGFLVLATVGENDRAIALAEKIIKFDPSARAELLQVAERASNATLVSHLRAR